MCDKPIILDNEQDWLGRFISETKIRTFPAKGLEYRVKRRQAGMGIQKHINAKSHYEEILACTVRRLAPDCTRIELAELGPECD